MLRPTNNFEEYISKVTQNFKKQTNNMYVYLTLEQNRIDSIRYGIIALVKLYKGIELSDLEKEFLNLYPTKFNYQQEITKCIAEIAYNISYETYEKAQNILKDETEYDILYNRSYDIFYDENGNEFLDNSKIDKSKKIYSKTIHAADAYKDYPKYLHTYLTCLSKSIANGEGINISNKECSKVIRPTINFNNKCFTSSKKKKLLFI